MIQLYRELSLQIPHRLARIVVENIAEDEENHDKYFKELMNLLKQQ